MRPIATDGVAWSVYVCLSVEFVSAAKTVGPIELPTRMVTRMGARNHCIRWGPDPQREAAIFVVCPAH